jgi:ABC-type lipoprotein release transport system permease subunit
MTSRLHLRLLLPLAWRNLWRNPRRTVITLLVVMVGLWSILTFAVLVRAWAASSRDTTLRLMTGEGQIHAPGYRDDPAIDHRMPWPNTDLLRQLHSPSVGAFALRVRVGAIVQSEYETLPATLVGVTPQEERRMSVIPAQIASGHYLGGSDDIGIVLGRKLAKRLKTRIGKRVVIMATATDGHLAERAFRVIGLFAATQAAEDEFAFTGIRTAQAFTAMGSDISEVAFDATGEQALPALVAGLRNAAPGLDVQTWKELAPLSYAVDTFFSEFVTMWLWIMFTLMATGIVNTQLMAVLQRRREFGLVQALGMRPQLVLLEVALESMLLIGIGVIAGAVLALATVRAFSSGLDLGFLARGAEVIGAGHVLYPRVNAGDFVLNSLIVWALSVLATLWPARRASRVSPVEAMSRV